MPTTPINGLRYPALSDNANVPLFVQNLATDVDSRLVAQFANSAARDAITPTTGMLVHTANDKRYWRYDGTAWQYAGGSPPPIVDAPVFGGWTAGAGAAPGAYRDASGLVHLVGVVTNNTAYTPSDGALHQLVTLPTGYRPSVTFICGLYVGGVGTISCQVRSDGEVRVINGSSVPQASNHYLVGIPAFHPNYSGIVPLA